MVFSAVKNEFGVPLNHNPIIEKRGVKPLPLFKGEVGRGCRYLLALKLEHES
jgi:hypothetical protein